MDTVLSFLHNQLIAEFMGARVDKVTRSNYSGNVVTEYQAFDGKSIIQTIPADWSDDAEILCWDVILNNVSYDSDLNHLMKVVNKIISLQFPHEINCKEKFYQIKSINDILINNIRYAMYHINFKLVYDSVVRYIEWYNKMK